MFSCEVIRTFIQFHKTLKIKDKARSRLNAI